MSTPVAIIGLTYDAEDLQTADLGIYLTITRGLNEGPASRGRDYIVPHLAGQVTMPRRKDHLDILLGGHVMGTGVDATAARADYRTNVRTLRELFASDSAAADLVATCEDGSTWTIACRPDSTDPLQVNEQVVSEFGYVSVRLFSVAPDWTVVEAGS